MTAPSPSGASRNEPGRASEAVEATAAARLQEMFDLSLGLLCIATVAGYFLQVVRGGDLNWPTA